MSLVLRRDCNGTCSYYVDKSRALLAHSKHTQPFASPLPPVPRPPRPFDTLPYAQWLERYDTLIYRIIKTMERKLMSHEQLDHPALECYITKFYCNTVRNRIAQCVYKNSSSKYRHFHLLK